MLNQVKANWLYTREHEWVEKLTDTLVRVGVTHFAQNQLGDIVFVELPKVGADIAANESIGSVESIKTVSDIFSPVTGKIVKVNELLESTPGLVNSGPYSDGWMVEVEIAGPEALEGLLTSAEYATLTGSDEA